MPHIAYYRVSPGGRRKDKKLLQSLDPDEQRHEVLGLDAQRTSVLNFLRGETPTHEFIEIESGKRHTNRPQLSAAIEECKRSRSKLVIAKLDRLARNVAFISGLMESKVQFVAVDMPDANDLTIHIIAAVAENERKMISNRVKAALSVIKTRTASGEVIGHDHEGNPLYKLGNPRLSEAQKLAVEALRRKPRYTRVAPATKMLIQELHKQGHTLEHIARTLNNKRIQSARGGKWWGSAIRKQL